MEKIYTKQLHAAVLITLGLLSLFLFFLAIATFKGISYVGRNISVQNTISVTGKGEVFAVPDVTTFDVGVTKQANTPDIAQAAATKTMNAITDYLKQNNIADADIKTSTYSINPNYSTSARPSIISYTANYSVTVKVRTADIAGKLLAGVSALGANMVSGLTFSIDKPDALKEQARALAITDAKAKAKRLAASLGISLAHITSFYESSDSPIYYAKAMSMSSGMVAPDAAPAPALPTGDQKITSNVTITYEIR